MVMALGTLQANAKKELADRCTNLNRIGTITKDDGGTVAPRAPLRRQQLADELAVRFVRPKRLAEPSVQRPDSLHAHAIRIGPQQVGPLVGPEVGVLRTIEQLVDQPLALVQTGVGEEGSRFLGSRQPADRAQIGPAMKRRVARRR